MKPKKRPQYPWILRKHQNWRKYNVLFSENDWNAPKTKRRPTYPIINSKNGWDTKIPPTAENEPNTPYTLKMSTIHPKPKGDQNTLKTLKRTKVPLNPKNDQKYTLWLKKWPKYPRKCKNQKKKKKEKQYAPYALKNVTHIYPKPKKWHKCP